MNTARHFGHFRHKASIRTYLVGLAAVILIPVILFGAWQIAHSAASERAQLEHNSESKAAQVAADIDHEMATAKATLVALASSHYLQTGDFGGFHKQCVEVANQLGAQFVLRGAPLGAQIVNSIVPWGEPLPPDAPSHSMDALKDAIRTGRPTVSNVFFGALSKKFMVSVGIPVTLNNTVAYYLSVALPVDIFANALQNAALPDQWLVTLIDRDDTIIARSEDQSGAAGTKLRAPDQSLRAMKDGFVVGTNRYGISYRWVWHRSESSGWFVSVGVPLTVLEAPGRLR